MDTPTPLPLSDDPQWPMKSILLVGYFGNKTPEGRRFLNRCWGAFAALAITWLTWIVISLTLYHHPPGRVDGIVLRLSLGAGYAYVAWALWKYLAELDEFTRELQYKAIALTYLTGFAAVSFVGLLTDYTHWPVDPLYFLALEPVRGLYLWLLVRRYR
jgi:hypothetical protein